MKNKLLIVLFFCNMVGLLNAQTNVPIDAKVKFPVLIDDINTQNYQGAVLRLPLKTESVLGLISGLTEKQKTRINCIEGSYSKKWQQLHKQFAKLNSKLQLAIDSKNKKQTKLATAKIKATIEQAYKLNKNTESKIAKQLFAKQLSEYEIIIRK